MNIVFYLLCGLLAGTFGGFFGIGGGIIMIPAMIFLFGMDQHQAQGTSLAAMIPPIGLLAAWRYYIDGNVNLKMALFICIGFFVGGYIGANFANKLPDELLRKMFGVLLFVLSLRMMLWKG